MKNEKHLEIWSDEKGVNVKQGEKHATIPWEQAKATSLADLCEGKWDW